MEISNSHSIKELERLKRKIEKQIVPKISKVVNLLFMI